MTKPTNPSAVSSGELPNAAEAATTALKSKTNWCLDGVDVSAFSSAKDLWTRFQERPTRLVITDRRFGDEFGRLDLVRKIRKHHPLPYIYVLMRSATSQLEEIKTGLDAGVDDYLVRPHNPFQIRSRVLVAMRWLTYIDSITGKQTERTGAGRG